MATASFQFLAFSLAIAVVFNLNRTVFWRQLVLLLASLGFLSYFSRGSLAWVPFVAFVAFGFISVRLIQTGWRRTGLAPVAFAAIAAFVWIKRYTFIPSPLFLHFPYVTLGLSYIFFRVLHLIIDAFHHQIDHKVSLVSYLNYTLNFTTFISGPIQRYQDFACYQLEPIPLGLDAFAVGRSLERIVVGFFKVNVLSLFLSMIQTRSLDALHSAATWDQRIMQGAIIIGSYPLYLYCNFSGYIDMVIGIARFLRIELPENFDRPFSSDNFMNFWGRWHITLSEWLKTYVYSPSLIWMMRKYPSRSIEPFLGAIAIFITFFLVGVWHGQTSEFLFFGLLQGGGVAAVKLYQTLMTNRMGKKAYKSLSNDQLYTDISRGLTFTWFAFTLLWFWSNWTQIGDVCQKLNVPFFLLSLLVILVVSTATLAVWERIRPKLLAFEVRGEPVFLSRYSRTVVNTALAVIAIAIVTLLNAPAPELVYKAF